MINVEMVFEIPVMKSYFWSRKYTATKMITMLKVNTNEVRKSLRTALLSTCSYDCWSCSCCDGIVLCRKCTEYGKKMKDQK